MFYNFKNFKNNIAIINNDGKKISYSDILLNHQQINKNFPKKNRCFF